MAPDYNVLPETVKTWLSKLIPDVRVVLPKYRVKVIIAIIAKALAIRSNTEFCFGLSEAWAIKAAARLAKLKRLSDLVQTQGLC